jgi:hypothetical protein
MFGSIFKLSGYKVKEHSAAAAFTSTNSPSPSFSVVHPPVVRKRGDPYLSFPQFYII